MRHRLQILSSSGRESIIPVSTSTSPSGWSIVWTMHGHRVTLPSTSSTAQVRSKPATDRRRVRPASDRGPLPLLRRCRRPRREGRRRRDAPRASTRPRSALENPLPAHKRAEILVNVAGLIGKRHEEVARTISRRGGQADQDRARRGVARDVDVHVRRGRGAQARRRDGPDGGVAGRRGQARLHAAQADRDRSARSRRSTSPATSSRTRSRPRSPPAAPSC